MPHSADYRDRLGRMTDEELLAQQRRTDLPAGQRQLLEEELAARDDSSQLGTDAVPVRVAVRDFDMPFWNIMLFMVKWVIASIPALIILLTVMILVGGLLVGFLREFR
jgi:hypothetical protein